jgi:glucokinase
MNGRMGRMSTGVGADSEPDGRTDADTGGCADAGPGGTGGGHIGTSGGRIGVSGGGGIGVSGGIRPEGADGRRGGAPAGDGRAGVVLGIDFGGTKIALATATASGEPLRNTRIETRASDGAAEVVRRAVEAANALVAATSGRLVAAGVSTFGVVRDGRIRLAPNVPGWEDLPLPAMLRDGLGVRALRVDNDVNAAAAAELHWGRLRGIETGLYVNLGTGTGAALIVGGRVIPGAHGAAGEIGYLLREPHEPGYFDGRAPLEEYASGSGLATRGSFLLGEPVTAANLFARREEPAVAALLDDAARALGTAIANLTTFLDPERVVVGGGMATAVLPALRDAVARAVPFPPPVEAARFTDDAPLVGAVALATRTATNEPRVSTNGTEGPAGRRA